MTNINTDHASMAQKQSRLALKRHLIQAVIDWASAEGSSCYVTVNTLRAMVCVPKHIVQPDGSITFDIGAHAVRNFQLSNEYLSFNARFSGVKHDIYIPVDAVMYVFNPETKDGIPFAPIFTDDELILMESNLLNGEPGPESRKPLSVAKPELIIEKPAKQMGSGASKPFLTVIK